MQYLFLARHGNTFAPGQKAVWVGARNDLPLVDTGLAQAQCLANELKHAAIKPQKIYAATLKRTVDYAQIIHDYLGVSSATILDKRLDELDYGKWSGLDNDEIKERFGSADLQGWNERGKWPSCFMSSEKNVEREVQSFVVDAVQANAGDKIILAVTSNGRLKYFLKLLPAIYEQYIDNAAWKVATGNFCVLTYSKGIWNLLCWNKKPSEIANLTIVDKV